MSKKHLVFHLYALADKRMARYFTVFPDNRAFLYFHKCSDLCVIADFTAIQVYKLINSYIFTKLYMIDDFF